MDVNTKKQQVRMEFDAVGVEQLERLLREKIANFKNNQQEINGKLYQGSLKLLSDITGISSTYLHQFQKGEPLRVDSINKLAHYFDIKYVVTNFIPKLK